MHAVTANARCATLAKDDQQLDENNKENTSAAQFPPVAYNEAFNKK